MAPKRKVDAKSNFAKWAKAVAKVRKDQKVVGFKLIKGKFLEDIRKEYARLKKK